MTIPYTTGQITLTNGSTAVVGVGTGWEVSLIEGGFIIPVVSAGNALPIQSIDSDTGITASVEWTGASGTYDYALVVDTEFDAQNLRNMTALSEYLQRLNNPAIAAIAGTTPANNQVLVYTGPSSATTVDIESLTRSIDIDATVYTLPERDAYDSEAAGFWVLVVDNGGSDERSALYYKISNASGDWSSAIYLTGIQGEKGDTGDTGPIGITDAGDYDEDSTYLARDIVLDNGSTWIAIASVPIDEPPPILPVTENTYWRILARKGTDGTGTGDVVGPSSAVANNLAVFDGNTGKLLKDGGLNPSSFGDVKGPALSTTDMLAVWDGATGKLIKNSTIPADSVIHGGSAQSLTETQKSQVAINSGSGLLSGFRNVLINPLFSINQRGVSGTVTLAAGAYGHDRMKAGSSGCTYTFAASNGVTTITITAGSLQQVVEASVFAGRSGTYYLSWVGSAQGRIGSGSYGVSGAISASCDGSGNVSVEFNSGTLSLVQLERDYVTEFSSRHIVDEIINCQRYFEKSYAINVNPGAIPTAREGAQLWLAAGSTVQSGANQRFMVNKRSTPAMVVYNPFTGGSAAARNYSASANFSATFTNPSEAYTGYLVIGASPVLGDQFGHQWTADAEI
jgi:hypothetical protein